MLQRLAVTLLLVGACKRAPAPLADRVERVAKVQYPGVPITRLDERRLEFGFDGGAVLLGLDNLAAYCDSHGNTCEQQIELQVRSVEQVLRRPAPTREQVRATLKNAEYLHTIAEVLADHDAGAAQRFAVRDSVAGLTQLYVLDLPDMVQPMSKQTQHALELSDDELEALARKNLDAALPQPTLAAVEGEPDVYGVYEGDDYACSQVLFPARFAPLAKKLGGKLWLTAPTNSVLIVTGKDDPQTLDRLRRLTADSFRQQPHPLSQTILEWSERGFVVRDSQ